MSWNDVLENWAHLTGALCRDFPNLDPEALRRFRGARGHLVTYLSQTHDLTEREAREVLQDWMTYFAPRQLEIAA